MKETVKQKLLNLINRKFKLDKEKTEEDIIRYVNQYGILGFINEKEDKPGILVIDYYFRAEEPNTFPQSFPRKIGAMENSMPDEIKRIQHKNIRVDNDFIGFQNVRHEYEILN